MNQNMTTELRLAMSALSAAEGHLLQARTRLARVEGMIQSDGKGSAAAGNLNQLGARSVEGERMVKSGGRGEQSEFARGAAAFLSILPPKEPTALDGARDV